MKLKTIKTMIALAMMIVGGVNFAWAGETSTIYHRATTDTDGATVWNASDDIKAGEWTGDTESAGVDATYGLKMSSSNGTMAITKSFSVTAGSTLIYDMVWNISNTVANGGYPHTYLYIGDKIYFDYNSRDSKGKSLNLYIGNTKEELGTFNVNSLLTIHLVVDTYTKEISSFTVTGTKSDASALEWSIAEENKSLLSSTSVVFNTLSLQVLYNNWAPNSYLQSVKVQETLSDVTYYNYTIKGVSGKTPISTFAFGSAAESETYSTYIPKVISYGGQYYVLDDAGNPNLTNYSASYTMGTSDENQVINYTPNTNVVYYREWEDVSGFSSTKSADKTMFSGGKGRTINSGGATMNVSFTVPVAGKYQIVIPYHNDNSSSRTHMIYLDGTEDANKLQEVSVYKNGGSGTYDVEVELSAGSHTIHIKCSSGMTSAFDYLMVTLNTPYISAVDNLGYTFSSTLPLDFTGTTVEAYTAEYNSSSKTVTLNRVYKVPANTGLFIKGEANDIPVLTGDADDMSTNNLVAVSAATTVEETDGDYTNYVLGLENGKPTFLKANATTVPAGKAYLQIPTPSEARARLTVTFADDAMGITDVKAQKAGAGVYYNLSGQRVASPSKGLYIVNGKKIIIK